MSVRKPSYSIADLAKLLKWSKYQVRQWIKANEIRTIRVGKGKVRVAINEISGPDGSMLDAALELAQAERKKM